MNRTTNRLARLLCLALTAALLLAGCAGKQPAQNAPMVSMYDLRTAMLQADPGLPEMKSVSSSDEKAGELFAYLSDFDYDKVEGYFLSYAADGMAYEIAVVCLKDSADVAALKASLKAHLEGRVSLYKSYAPEQVPKAEAAELVSQGRYVALIMCGDQAAVKTAFQNGVQ